VGVFSAYTSATAGPRTSYAIAARDLAPGVPVTADDFELVPIDLPPEQRRHAFDSTQALHDAVVVDELLAGELVQAGSLVATGAETGARSVSFAVEPARALGGVLKASERVDILATFGAGDQACTSVVAADVPIVAVDHGNDALVAQPEGITVTVAVDAAQDAVAVVHAANAATVTLVRATGAAAASAERVCTAARPEAGE
jgi:Flp pilus assembly protein CpaB